MCCLRGISTECLGTRPTFLSSGRICHGVLAEWDINGPGAHRCATAGGIPCGVPHAVLTRLPAGSTRSTWTFSVLSVRKCVHTEYIHSGLVCIILEIWSRRACVYGIRRSSTPYRSQRRGLVIGLIRGLLVRSWRPGAGDPKAGNSQICGPYTYFVRVRAHTVKRVCRYVRVYVCTLTSWHCPVSSADSETMRRTGRFSVPKRQCRGESLCLVRSCLRPPGYSVKEVQCVPYCTLSGCGRPGVGLRSAAPWLSGRALGKY